MIDRLPPLGAPASSPIANPAGSREGGEGMGARRTGLATSESGQGRGDARLTPEQLREVQALQQTDRKVRAHEMAHVAAGGGVVRSGASYSYQTGPDGQRYAVSGEVSIDTSPGQTPQETIHKAARIRAAALAPADPSPQDRKVAAMADRMAMQARLEQVVSDREAESERKTEPAVPAGGADEPRADQRGRVEAAYGRASQTAPQAGVNLSAVA